MNDAKVAVESHEEWLTLNKSNIKVQNQVIGYTSNLANVISQRKLADYFIKHIKYKEEPKSCWIWKTGTWNTVFIIMLLMYLLTY